MNRSIKNPAPELLVPVGTRIFPAISLFDSGQFFRHDNVFGIHFYPYSSAFGVVFQENFIGKVERDIPPFEVNAGDLLVPASDGDIRREIVRDREDIWLAHLAELLKAQPNGEKGILVTRTYRNVFRIPDKNQKMWSIGLSLDGGGWTIYAHPFGFSAGWHAGSRVFFC